MSSRSPVTRLEWALITHTVCHFSEADVLIHCDDDSLWKSQPHDGTQRMIFRAKPGPDVLAKPTAIPWFTREAFLWKHSKCALKFETQHFIKFLLTCKSWPSGWCTERLLCKIWISCVSPVLVALQSKSLLQSLQPGSRDFHPSSYLEGNKICPFRPKLFHGSMINNLLMTASSFIHSTKQSASSCWNRTSRRLSSLSISHSHFLQLPSLGCIRPWQITVQWRAENCWQMSCWCQAHLCLLQSPRDCGLRPWRCSAGQQSCWQYA